MKKLLIVVGLMASASSFADCTARMFYKNSGQLVPRTPVFTEYTCYDALKECGKKLSPLGLRGVAECREVGQGPGPVPGPGPGPGYPDPYPYPNPNPDYGYDVRRPLMNGEAVYYNNRAATVIAVGYNGQYAIRTTNVYGNSVTLNANRSDLSITNGCNQDVCVNQQVINVSTGRNATVAALSYNGQFVIRTTNDYGNSSVITIDRSKVAVTEGCTYGYPQVCVGYQVYYANRYATIIGIQADQRVVIRTTNVYGNTAIVPNVRTTDLMITAYH